MLDKGILNRITKLELLYPVIDFNVEENIKNIIEELETVLQYEIKGRIQLPNKKYFNLDRLYKDIFSFLTIEELRLIAYSNNKDKTV